MRPLDLKVFSHTESEDKRRFQLITLCLAAFYYPIWVIVFHFLTPEARNPISIRIAISVWLFAVLGLFVTKRIKDARVMDWLIFGSLSAIATHAFFLYAWSPQNPMFAIQMFTGVYAVPILMISRVQLRVYSGLMIGLSLWAFNYYDFEPIHFLVLSLSMLTFFCTFWFAHPGRTWTMRALERSNQEIWSMLQQQNQLIGAISHDLRTPLMVLTLLMPKVARIMQDKEGKEMVDLLIRNSNYMRNLVENSLEFSFINSEVASLKIEEFPLSPIVDEVIASFGKLNDDAFIRFENRVPPDLQVQADRLRILQIFYNLISNSMHHMPKGGTVTIEVQPQDQSVLILVSDTGVGIPKDQLETIFEPFFKGDRSRNKRSSVGLGLSICRQIVSLHGQKIGAENRGLGQGATVWFSIKTSKEIK